MKVRVTNVSIDEAFNYYKNAGFTPSRTGNDEVALLPHKASRDELRKAVDLGYEFVTRNQEARLTVFSGGKGRPFNIPKNPS